MIKTIDQKTPFAVIGDIHECVKELNCMLESIPANYDIYLTGDYLNKGGNTEKVLKTLTRLKESGRLKGIVKGNHEYYVYRRLKGIIPENKRIENTSFTSVGCFNENPSLIEKFMSLYDSSVSQLTIKRPSGLPDVVITHSPCRETSLNVDTPQAEINRINFRFSSKNTKVMAEDLEFMVGQASSIDYYHVFGHVALSAGPSKLGNSYWVDSGCVNGGMLSAVVFNNKCNPYFISIPSNRPQRDLFDMSLLYSVTNVIEGEI